MRGERDMHQKCVEVNNINVKCTFCKLFSLFGNIVCFLSHKNTFAFIYRPLRGQIHIQVSQSIMLNKYKGTLMDATIRVHHGTSK